MIDALYVRIGLRNEKQLDPKYEPKNAIKNIIWDNPEGEKLAVIFPGWHNNPTRFPIKRLIRRLTKRGWAVLAYNFHDQILVPEEDIVVDSFRYITRQVSDYLEVIHRSGKYSQIHLIGISLGTVPWAMVADRFTKFTGATIIVGGDDLAIDMWQGIRTQHYRKALQKLHVTMRRLDDDWDAIAPVNHLRHFKGKPVKVFMSRTDRIIRSDYQKKLVDRLGENGASVNVKDTRFGHAMSIVWFCLFGSPL